MYILVHIVYIVYKMIIQKFFPTNGIIYLSLYYNFEFIHGL